VAVSLIAGRDIRGALAAVASAKNGQKLRSCFVSNPGSPPNPFPTVRKPEGSKGKDRSGVLDVKESRSGNRLALHLPRFSPTPRAPS
jgi:hypothetical protein